MILIPKTDNTSFWPNSYIPFYISASVGSQPPTVYLEKPSQPPAGVSSIPNLPDIPSGSLRSNQNSVGGQSSAGGEDVDFDDLTRRFEELKKKK